jgi:hypothetical protein
VAHVLKGETLSFRNLTKRFSLGPKRSFGSLVFDAVATALYQLGSFPNGSFPNNGWAAGCRQIASCECKRRAEHFAPFVASMSDDGDISVEQFCRRNVEPMGVESDHIHIVLLTEGARLCLWSAA